ncbi:MAG TPA: hypothetical protein VK636_15675 [Gemmatimonadaceae bacterium]|nr:hypothetical protein [Gemmatimonadaceae bacterium]
MLKWVAIQDKTLVDLSTVALMRFSLTPTWPHYAKLSVANGNTLFEMTNPQIKDEAFIQKLRKLASSSPEWVLVRPVQQEPDESERYANLNHVGLIFFGTDGGKPFEVAHLATTAGPFLGSTDREDTTQRVRDWSKGAQ